MLKQTLINFSSYLVYFLPLAILTGPFLPDLFISVISLIFLFLLIRYKEFEYINNFYFKIFVVFCAYLIFCSLISDFPYFSLKSSMFYFRFGTFSIAICELFFPSLANITCGKIKVKKRYNKILFLINILN